MWENPLGLDEDLDQVLREEHWSHFERTIAEANWEPRSVPLSMQIYWQESGEKKRRGRKGHALHLRHLLWLVLLNQKRAGWPEDAWYEVRALALGFFKRRADVRDERQIEELTWDLLKPMTQLIRGSLTYRWTDPDGFPNSLTLEGTVGRHALGKCFRGFDFAPQVMARLALLEALDPATTLREACRAWPRGTRIHDALCQLGSILHDGRSPLVPTPPREVDVPMKRAEILTALAELSLQAHAPELYIRDVRGRLWTPKNSSEPPRLSDNREFIARGTCYCRQRRLLYDDPGEWIGDLDDNEFPLTPFKLLLGGDGVPLDVEMAFAEVGSDPDLDFHGSELQLSPDDLKELGIKAQFNEAKVRILEVNDNSGKVILGRSWYDLYLRDAWAVANCSPLLPQIRRLIGNLAPHAVLVQPSLDADFDFHYGVSAVTIDRDGIIVLAHQKNDAKASAGLVVPGASGSSELVDRGQVASSVTIYKRNIKDKRYLLKPGGSGQGCSGESGVPSWINSKGMEVREAHSGDSYPVHIDILREAQEEMYSTPSNRETDDEKDPFPAQGVAFLAIAQSSLRLGHPDGFYVLHSTLPYREWWPEWREFICNGQNYKSEDKLKDQDPELFPTLPAATKLVGGEADELVVELLSDAEVDTCLKAIERFVHEASRDRWPGSGRAVDWVSPFTIATLELYATYVRRWQARRAAERR